MAISMPEVEPVTQDDTSEVAPLHDVDDLPDRDATPEDDSWRKERQKTEQQLHDSLVEQLQEAGVNDPSKFMEDVSRALQGGADLRSAVAVARRKQVGL